MTPTAATDYSVTAQLGETLAKYRNTAAFLGLLGIVACIAGWVLDSSQFYRAYLVGYFFWFGISLGGLALLMVQHCTGGAWGIVIRRILEASSRTLPFMVVLFIPILIGMPSLYQWADPSKVAHDAILQKKQLYLNPTFWIARVIIFFAVWNLLMYLLNKWSKQEDAEGGFKHASIMEKLSAPGIPIYVYTLTFAVTDWLMSLTPHWFSTIYGFLCVCGQGLAVFSFATAVVALLSQVPPMSYVVTKKHLHDLGKLMLAFVMLWAYMAFSQLLIIWAGNLPEEIAWYTVRMGTTWIYVGAALLLLHFVLPFLLLLSQTLKRNPRSITVIAVYIVVIHMLDVIWLVEPNFHPEGLYISWQDIAALLGVGGIFVALFLMELVKRPLMPLGAPDLQKALAHGRQHSH